MLYQIDNKSLFNPITLKFSDYNAGALTSLVFRGKEYVDDFDHGRQWQSAFSIGGEIWNPTEAGGEFDGINPRPSSSQVLDFSLRDNLMTTLTQMAFWREVNGKRLSDSILRKSIRIENQFLVWETEFQVQSNIVGHCVFEVLTGYMPKDFNRFYYLNGTELIPIQAPIGGVEAGKLFLMSTADGKHAVSAKTEGIPQGIWNVGYGMQDYSAYGTNKWNCVYRVNNPKGNYKFSTKIAIGTVEEVISMIGRL
jgi:hypothetical protein